VARLFFRLGFVNLCVLSGVDLICEPKLAINRRFTRIDVSACPFGIRNQSWSTRTIAASALVSETDYDAGSIDR
jgi:hypothetical protein